MCVLVAAICNHCCDIQVSHNFATLSESLYIAERKAREQTRLRGELTKAMAIKEKESKEADLRDLAARLVLVHTHTIITHWLPSIVILSTVYVLVSTVQCGAGASVHLGVMIEFQ
jgi:SKIP/SNW domain